MNHKVRFGVVGCGDRGFRVYAQMAKYLPEEMEIVAAADPNPEKLAAIQKEFSLPDQCCFSSGDALLKQDKMADALILATLDRDHVRYAIPALKKGYALLMEKPISPSLEECQALEKVYQQEKQPVVICHVLRYTDIYRTLKHLLDSKIIGTVEVVESEENVGYWHQAHSFVRGNWRNSDTTSPMILQKCCHDMDLFVWLFHSRGLSVSSLGDLSFFKKENAPQGSNERCWNCAVKAKCPFDAEKIYLSNPETGFLKGNKDWPVRVVSMNPSEDNLRAALKNGPYGRCVFRCDNNVVDRQLVQIRMENGVLISHMMTAFSPVPHRAIRILGSEGEIRGNEDLSAFIVQRFGEEAKTVSLEHFEESAPLDLQGHSGGDYGLMKDFLALLRNGEKAEGLTELPVSLESHYLCFAAEASRLNHGKEVFLSDYRLR